MLAAAVWWVHRNVLSHIHGDLFRLEVATIVMETFPKHDQQLQYVLYTYQLSTANESMPTNPPSPYGRGNHSTKTWKDKQHELHVTSTHLEDHLPSFKYDYTWLTHSGLKMSIWIKLESLHIHNWIRKWLDILSHTLFYATIKIAMTWQATGCVNRLDWALDVTMVVKDTYWKQELIKQGERGQC